MHLFTQVRHTIYCALLPFRRGRVCGALCCLCLVVLAACGVPRNQVRISGSYEGMTQADFPILSLEGGVNMVDTLHIVGGEFDFLTDVNGDATFCIIYPNNSQLMLWAHGGERITIKGNPQDLWHVVVKGNPENELYNEFRQATEASDTTKLRQEAARIIRQHPDSRVSLYLLTQYFVIPDDVATDSINTLYQVLRAAMPKDSEVAKLGGLIRQRTMLRAGAMMPDFDVVTPDSVHHNLKKYKGSTLFLYFWSGWQPTSNITHRELLSIKEHLEDPTDGSAPQKAAILGYSLEVDSTSFRINMDEDTRSKIPTYCDFQGFVSPLVQQLGIKSVPLVIVIDPKGKVKLVASSMEPLKKMYKTD